jgi:transcriptional regulator with XRE-family HTH domain
MKTPSDLRAIRTRCNLSIEEAAKVTGLTCNAYEKAERAKQHNVFSGIVSRMISLEVEADDVFEEMLAVPGPYIGFMNDTDFAKFEPGWALRLRFNSVHRGLLADCQAEDERPIVELIGADYVESLGGLDDTRDRRRVWAEARIKAFRQIEGLPPGVAA